MDIAVCRKLIESNFPQIVLQTVVPITRGRDSFVLEVNDELIFRFPRRDNTLKCLQRELLLLPILKKALSTPIPHFVYIGHGAANYPYTFVGYRRLCGTALEDGAITPEQLTALIPALATFLNELHAFPVTQAVQAGVQDTYTYAMERTLLTALYRHTEARFSTTGC